MRMAVAIFGPALSPKGTEVGACSTSCYAYVSLHGPGVCAAQTTGISAEVQCLADVHSLSVRSHVYDWSGRWQPHRNWVR